LEGVAISEKNQQDFLKVDNELELRGIQAGILFCPVCGKMNDFSGVQEGTTRFFCAYCHRGIYSFWDEYYDGKLSLQICSYCNHPTFQGKKFCLSCGKQQANYKARKALYFGSEKVTKRKLLHYLSYILILVIPLVLYFLVFYILETYGVIDDDLEMTYIFFLGIPVILIISLIVVFYLFIRRRRVSR
jgi:hypothetical protein